MALFLRYNISILSIIHCNGKLDTIMLDWDWNVRIGHFCQSISPDHPTVPIPGDPIVNQGQPSINSHHLTPECCENEYGCENLIMRSIVRSDGNGIIETSIEVASLLNANSPSLAFTKQDRGLIIIDCAMQDRSPVRRVGPPVE
jgi:hypothetical protein